MYSALAGVPSPSVSPPPLKEKDKEKDKKSKTDAFFGSPFSQHSHIEQPTPKTKPRTLQIPLSRLFPSRYSSHSESKREIVFLDYNNVSPTSTTTSSSTSSASPISTSPITPSSPSRNSHESDNRKLAVETDTERTPRPPNLEPSLTQVLNSTKSVEDREVLGHDHYQDENTVPSPGMIIHSPSLANSSSSFSSLASMSLMPTPYPPSYPTFVSSSSGKPTTFRDPYNSTSDDLPTPNQAIPEHESTAVSVRLLSPLGQGAFSAVWLARDESPVSLADRARDVEKGRRRGRKLSKRRPHAETLSRKSSTKSTSGTSAYQHGDAKRSLSRSGSVRSVASTFSTTSTVSTSSTMSMFSTYSTLSNLSTPSVLSTMDDVIRVSMGKGGVCGLRPLGGAGAQAAIVDGKLCEKSGREEQHRSGEESKCIEYGGPCATALEDQGRLVAVKMTPLPRSLRRQRTQPYGDGEAGYPAQEEVDGRDRMCVSFVREIEVLRHISHPNITPLLTHLCTPTHQVLVLPHLPGGDLLSLVNSDIAYKALSQSVMQRIWCELCRAVAWMHSVGLVHRDIKLENILLTTSAFAILTPTSARPTLASLLWPNQSAPNILLTPSDAPIRDHASASSQQPSLHPRPLIQLTDFGLSRFVDLENPWLETRCGSEAYAAPELVIGRSGNISDNDTLGNTDDNKVEVAQRAREAGMYDARETDSWACGVVLYALACRKLPFGEGPEVVEGERGIIGERRRRASVVSKADRRRWLMRIAKGEYDWPDVSLSVEERNGYSKSGECELVGHRLAESVGARTVVGKLLVRDPSRRARVEGLVKEDDWVKEGLAVGNVGREVNEKTQDVHDEHIGSGRDKPKGLGLGLGLDVNDVQGADGERDGSAVLQNGNSNHALQDKLTAGYKERIAASVDPERCASFGDHEDVMADGEEMDGNEGYLVEDPPMDSIVCQEVHQVP